MSKMVSKLVLESGAEVLVAGNKIIHATPGPNIHVGRELNAMSFKAGDPLVLRDNGFEMGRVGRVGILHLEHTYEEWLARIDALSMRFTGKVKFTAMQGALSERDPWVEMYIDGLTPEEAWDEFTVVV